ncbi:MAG: hypothetical protein GHCLOJNM_01775 [bacterium]|nr:hypothetical protein [bacterium]
MSVNRDFCDPKTNRPEYLLLDPKVGRMGIASFRVEDLPSKRFHGGSELQFLPMHRPQRRNYLHSQVEVYRNGVHVTHQGEDGLPIGVYQRWQKDLARKAVVIRQPESEER